MKGQEPVEHEAADGFELLADLVLEIGLYSSDEDLHVGHLAVYFQEGP